MPGWAFLSILAAARHCGQPHNLFAVDRRGVSVLHSSLLKLWLRAPAISRPLILAGSFRQRLRRYGGRTADGLRASGQRGQDFCTLVVFKTAARAPGISRPLILATTFRQPLRRRSAFADMLQNPLGGALLQPSSVLRLQGLRTCDRHSPHWWVECSWIACPPLETSPPSFSA